MKSKMDGLPYDENQIYPSAPLPNEVDDLSVRAYSTYCDIGYHDKSSNKV